MAIDIFYAIVLKSIDELSVKTSVKSHIIELITVKQSPQKIPREKCFIIDIRSETAGCGGLARVVAISLLRQKICVELIISGYRRYMYLKVRFY